MSATTIPALEINHLSVTYHHKPVLWDICATIPRGVVLGVVGPNGAGKTTLIKTLLGLIKPLAGTIKIYGDSISSKRHEIAYIPQRMSIDWDFPATVFDVVMMGRYGHIGWFKRPKQHDIDHVHRALELVGLTAHMHNHISQLSGGQQQRMFIARALVQEASLYLLDEPFAGIDATTEKSMMALLKQLAAQQKTIIIVHHDMHTMPTYFDWLLMVHIKQIAFGPSKQIFTYENVHATFGTSSTTQPFHS